MAKHNLQITDISFWSPHENNNGGMRIEWVADIGWGQFNLYKDKEGNLHADTEYLGEEFAKEILSLVYNKIVNIY